MDEKEFVRNRRAYLLFNEERKKRAVEISPKSAGVALNFVPFLLHVNHPDFPGYIPADANPVCGIHQFTPGEANLHLARKFFPDSVAIRGANPNIYPRRFVIESLMLMGSIGSVAQNAKSDFDYWVCVKLKDFAEGEVDLLKQKLAAVEKWADSQGIEVHFFLTDIFKARVNNFGSSDKESAGSSQAKILKEEFYRTVILVAGKFPMWWLFPPGVTDEQYASLVEDLKTSGLGLDGYLDLGNPGRISTGELFGAALWQMNKAMDSPYKSVLKMGLLEGFLDNAESNELLCDSLKQRVFFDPKLVEVIDPYLIMLDRLLAYYERHNRPEVVDLLRKCLYIKVGEKLKMRDVRNPGGPYKSKMMGLYAYKWQWKEELLEQVNAFKDWDFEKVNQLGNSVHEYMITTYKNLSDRLNGLPDAHSIINDTDRTILGRKLFTFYSKKPGKVELLKKVFDEALLVDNLTINLEVTRDRKKTWQAYRGDLKREFAHRVDVSSKLLKKGPDLVSIIAWLAHNGIADKTTFFTYIPNPTEVSLNDIHDVHRGFLEFFPSETVSSLPNEYLLKDAFIRQVYIVVNMYSGKWQTNPEMIHLLYLNSWGEIFSEFYPAQEGLKKLLAYTLGKRGFKDRDWANFYRIFVPNRNKPQALVQQVDNYMKQVIKKAGEMAAS